MKHQHFKSTYPGRRANDSPCALKLCPPPFPEPNIMVDDTEKSHLAFLVRTSYSFLFPDLLVAADRSSAPGALPLSGNILEPRDNIWHVLYAPLTIELNFLWLIHHS